MVLSGFIPWDPNSIIWSLHNKIIHVSEKQQDQTEFKANDSSGLDELHCN